MERLTYRDANGEAWYSDAGTEADRLHFIADMEDILGDDYDLDRLRCAVESLAEAEAANTQLDGAATTLMESNRKLAEALEAEKARADEAEAALTAAVRDMEAMALTIRQRRDHDTECCPFCKYDCPEEDYCPGWEGEECFQWRGK